MKFPSWQVIREKISIFQQKAKDGIEQFKRENPIAAAILEATFDYLPPPFNAIAAKIFNSTEGTVEDKITSVLNYLNEIESKGEQHYIEITSMLENVLVGVNDIRTITAKESSLQDIREILLANSDDAKVMMTDLKNGMEVRLEGINSKLDVLLQITRSTNTFGQVSENRLKPSQQEFFSKPPKIVVPDAQGNTINLKKGDTSVLSIEYDSLVNLSEADELALNTYHKNMLNYQKILLGIESELPMVIEPAVKTQYMLKIDDITKKMCDEFNKVNKLIKPIGLDLTKYYTNIAEICATTGKDYR